LCKDELVGVAIEGAVDALKPLKPLDRARHGRIAHRQAQRLCLIGECRARHKRLKHRFVKTVCAQVRKVHRCLRFGDLCADLVLECPRIILRGDLGVADFAQTAGAAPERANAEARKRDEQKPQDDPDEEA
jgi:hypothetical protein